MLGAFLMPGRALDFRQRALNAVPILQHLRGYIDVCWAAMAADNACHRSTLDYGGTAPATML